MKIQAKISIHWILAEIQVKIQDFAIFWILNWIFLNFWHRFSLFLWRENVKVLLNDVYFIYSWWMFYMIIYIVSLKSENVFSFPIHVIPAIRWLLETDFLFCQTPTQPNINITYFRLRLNIIIKHKYQT